MDPSNDSLCNSVFIMPGILLSQQLNMLFLYAGTPLGDKATEVSQKVATDTAEELKKAAAAYEGDVPGLRTLENLSLHIYTHCFYTIIII